MRDVAVVIGRFQPPHVGHIKLFEEALEIAERLIVCVGSTNNERTVKNPFSFEARKLMIQRSLGNYMDVGRLDVVPILDLETDEDWVHHIIRTVDTHEEARYRDNIEWPRNIILVGSQKHDTDYLQWFPKWEYREIEQDRNFCATDIREELYKTGKYEGDRLHPYVKNHVNAWTGFQQFRDRQNEFNIEHGLV